MNKSKQKEFPEVANFSAFFQNRKSFSKNITDVIADVYSWSTNLEQKPENLPLPFVSNNDEVVWSYLKHQNKQLDVMNRKFKGFLEEMSGKQHIPILKKDDEDEDEEMDDEEDIGDEDVDDEEEMDEIEDEDEEEEDCDLFNLKDDDLKNLDADLKKMAEEEDSDEENEEEEVEKPEAKKYKKSIVDDAFFSLEEMNDVMNQMERNGGKLKEDVMFEDDDDWDGKTTYTYEDFFGSRADVENAEKEKDGKKKDKKRKVAEVADESIDNARQKKRVRFAMDEEEEEGEEDEDMDDEDVEDEEDLTDAPVLLGADLEEEAEESGFAKRQKAMKQKISKLEEENLAPRTWELSGEVAADQRERNTLLEQHVEFDHGAKRAPEVTEEFTDKLEELIKQRIRDKVFDDPVRVKKVEATGPKFQTEAIEDIHNHKTTLAEVYEKEYQTTTGTDNGDKKVVNEAHESIKKKMGELFKLIDALTHFEYRPEQAKDDVKIVSNMSSLRVEEVGAMASSEGQLMAPEEVSKKINAIEKSKEERDRTDKLRERRKKKAKQRALVEKFGEDKVFGEQKAEKALKKKKKEVGNGEKAEKLKSSNFFAKLQETVQQEKRDGAKTKKKVIKRVKTDKNSAAIKL